MAGIGFSLRNSFVSESLTARLGSLGHSAVVAAGPWLLAIFSLGVITIVCEPVSGIVTLVEFRTGVIYAFSISLVVAAPIAIVSTRLVSDAVFASQFDRIGALFIAALLSTAAIAPPVIVYLFVFLFEVRDGFAVVTSALTVLVSLIWIAMAFCGTLKEYRRVTEAFAYGLLFSTAGVITMSIFGYGPAHMLGAFTAGLSISFLLLSDRILQLFPDRSKNAMAEVLALLKSTAQRPLLATAGLLAAATIWIDKWIMWSWSPIRETAPNGLSHAPLYDSAMFISCLAVIPSLALYVVSLETSLLERTRIYFNAVLHRQTLRTIEEEREALESATISSLNRVIVFQLAASAIVVMLAPQIVELLNLRFEQITILQYGAIGVVFQFIFVTSSSIVIFLDRRWCFLFLQLFAVVTNGVFTAFSIWLGQDFLGLGYLFAFMCSGIVAYACMVHTLADLNYLTFLGNNQTIQSSKY